MKKYLFVVQVLFCGLLLSACSSDETSDVGAIYGVVSDAETIDLLRGVSMTLSPGDFSATTDAEGYYEFVGLTPGEYTLQARATGYKAVSRQIPVFAGSRTLGNISLAPATSSSSVRLSTSVLDFGAGKSEFTLLLYNTGASSVSWFISGVNVPWLSFYPMQGETAKGQLSEIVASIDRDAIKSAQTTEFTIDADGVLLSVSVRVDVENSSADLSAELSTSVLDFGTDYSDRMFSIYNTGNGVVSWYISGIDVPWLSFSLQQGEIAVGGSSNVTVFVDRSKISSSQTTSFLVNAAGVSKSVSVSVRKTGGGTDPSGGDEVEDYSSAAITSCDYRVKAEIVSCKRSGSSVIFTYTLTNDGLGNVNDWRIYPPSSGSLISGGTRSVITDDQGNEYPYPTMTFRTQSTTGYNPISDSFPEDVPCKGTVTIKDVPATVKKLTALIGVYAYPNSVYNMSDSKVVFKNVPIY